MFVSYGTEECKFEYTERKYETFRNLWFECYIKDKERQKIEKGYHRTPARPLNDIEIKEYTINLMLLKFYRKQLIRCTKKSEEVKTDLKWLRDLENEPID